MVGPNGFKASGLLSLPGVLGTAGNLSAHTSFFVHLSNPLYVLIHLPTSFHHPCILCPLSHLHNLTCHAFVPLCLSLFLPILPFFSLSVVHFQAWWSGRKKDDALSLHYFLISASRKEGRERDKVKSGKTEGWEEYRSSAEWLQNGDWDRSYCSCGDATLHRERGSVCEREGGLNSLNQCKKNTDVTLFHTLFTLDVYAFCCYLPRYQLINHLVLFCDSICLFNLLQFSKIL